MSYYDSGFSDARVGAVPFAVVLPGTIKQEIESIDHYVRRLNHDVQTHKAQLGPELVEDWHLFVEDWQTFVKNSESWFSRSSAVTYDRALDYRKRADAWAEILRRRNAASESAETLPAPAPKGDLISSVLKLAAIGIAAYVGVNVYRGWKASKQRQLQPQQTEAA